MYSLLIVEDEEYIRKGIVSLIDYKKFKIDTILEAENGKKALEIFNEYKPDIILCDINIPIIDGISFAKKVRLIKEDTYIVFITGYDYKEYLLSALKLKAYDYILKPVSKIEIEEILIKIIDNLNLKNKNHRINELISDINVNNEIIKIIDKQISNPDLSLKLISDKLNFSSNYVSILIKKQLGISFQDYIIKQRITKAKLLLLTTNKKIYEIAYDVGMNDVNYFSTRFKKIVGKTPKQYQMENTNE